MSCFKAYDIRGKVPSELNEDLARRIGQAYACIVKPKQVAVGYDIRLSSPQLAEALMEGLQSQGVDVLDIGLAGTEQIYFTTFHQKLDGGIIVTASHNPSDYNGMKLVTQDARPISGDSGLRDIEGLAINGEFTTDTPRGKRSSLNIVPDYVQHLLSYIDAAQLAPLKIVVNAGNGGAGLAIDALESYLPFEFIKIQHQPDGHFPNGVPNPLLPENRDVTARAVREHKADFGIAWDGDYDRCFLFDESGEFIEGYYIVGLLAEAFLSKNAGEKVIHDPRLTWNTIDVVEQAGGVPVQSKTGHAFIKERMRLENAVYGGEMSAHHYFRDFAYCDSGMIPWLLIAELVSQQAVPLSKMVAKRIDCFPASGEINFKLADADACIHAIKSTFIAQAKSEDYTDGLSLDMGQWRFNLRKSNTESMLRLNVESRQDKALMKEKTSQIISIIGQFS